jgi:MFS family permease
MHLRWKILAVLTLARTAMGFQFQVVTAAGTGLTQTFDLTGATLGLLIGLYLLPGIAVAIPGGWLGQRFGDKRVVLAGLAMMAGGALLCAAVEIWPAMIAGRVLSGLGAVLLNVLLTKMTADWFKSRDLPFAMGVLIMSWPLGIAVAMVIMPSIALAIGWPAAFLMTGAASAGCLALVGWIYQPAEGAAARPVSPGLSLPRHELALTLLAGSVWALFNIPLIVLLSFGPSFLTAQGAGEIAAQATVSAVSWLLVPTTAFGGWIASRVARPNLLLTGGVTVTAGLILLLPLTGGSLALFALIGFLFGLPAAVIMTLLVQSAAPERRSIAAGIFFTCYYLAMTAGGPVAGWARDMTGDPAAPVWFAGVILAASLVPFALFRLLQRRAAA